MTREEELIRLLVRESIKEELELNELLGINLFGKKDQPEVIQGKSNGMTLQITPQDAKIQWDNHNRPEGDPLRTKINDPNRLKAIKTIVDKNFPQPKQTQKQNYNAPIDPWSGTGSAGEERTAHGRPGLAPESRKRRFATLR